MTQKIIQKDPPNRPPEQQMHSQRYPLQRLASTTIWALVEAKRLFFWEIGIFEGRILKRPGRGAWTSKSESKNLQNTTQKYTQNRLQRQPPTGRRPRAQVREGIHSESTLLITFDAGLPNLPQSQRQPPTGRRLDSLPLCAVYCALHTAPTLASLANLR